MRRWLRLQLWWPSLCGNVIGPSSSRNGLRRRVLVLGHTRNVFYQKWRLLGYEVSLSDFGQIAKLPRRGLKPRNWSRINQNRQQQLLPKLRPSLVQTFLQMEIPNLSLKAHWYRVTIPLVQNLPLNSEHMCRFGLSRPRQARPKRNFCFEVNRRF